MRRLLPGPAPGDDMAVDLDELYWVPSPGRLHARAVMVASADGAAQAQGRAGGLSGAADIELSAILCGQADVILARATTVRVEGYAGEQPSAARQEWRKARGLSEAPPIAVVTRACLLDRFRGSRG